MNGTTIRDMVNRLADGLLATETMVVTAESCTGGGLAYWLTSLPGSSRWYERGFITYSNIAKQELLAVPGVVLSQYGAVSEEAAAAMVQGALVNSHAGLAVAITGIAGPAGGTAAKPVGTVCLGWGDSQGWAVTVRLLFSGDRQAVREQAIMAALQGLLDRIQSRV